MDAFNAGMAIVAQSTQEPSSFEQNSREVHQSKVIDAGSDERMMLVTSDEMNNGIRRIRTQHA